MLELNWRHRKNCECRPLSPPVVGQQRLSWILILNCKNYNQCLNCYKSVGLSHVAIVSAHHRAQFRCRILLRAPNCGQLKKWMN